MLCSTVVITSRTQTSANTIRVKHSMTLFCLFEECECQNDEDGCVVGVAGRPTYHASPTILLMSLEQFNLDVVLLANIV